MKKIITCLASAFLMVRCLSQSVDSIPSIINKYSDTVQRFLNANLKEAENTRISNKTVSPSVFKRLIDKYFTQLAYDRNALPNGNSASLNIENETKLNLSLAQKSNLRLGSDTNAIGIFGAGVTAKIDKGVSELFNGMNATTGTGFFLNFAILPWKNNRKIKQDVAVFNPDGTGANLPATAYLEKVRYMNDFKSEYLTRIPEKLRILHRRLDAINRNCVRQNTGCYEEEAALALEKEQIMEEFKKEGVLGKSPDEITKALTEKFQSDLEAIETKYRAWEYLKLWWISGGITYNRDSYPTYDGNLSLAKRLGSKDFNAWGGRITFNHLKENYTNTLLKWIYFNVSYAPSRTNNIKGLDDEGIAKRIAQPPTSGNDTSYVFETNKQAKNITNKIYKESWEHSVSSTFTTMFGRNERFGLNFLAETVIFPIEKPIFNTKAGLLLRLNNNKYDPKDTDGKTRVNFEVFIRFNDMSDVYEKHNSVWQKRVIGISTTVPFNKIFFNN